jgi:hypothetical protein
MTPYNSYEFNQMRQAELMQERDEIRRANMLNRGARLARATAKVRGSTARRVRTTLAFAFGTRS